MTQEPPHDELTSPDEQAPDAPPPEGDDAFAVGGEGDAMPDAESADPLSAMAAGVDLNEVDPYLEQQRKAARALDGLPEEEDDAPADVPQTSASPAAVRPAVVAAAAASSPEVTAKNAAERARAKAVQAAAASLQFKQFMIPLLTAVGLLLVGMGAIPWFYNPLENSPNPDTWQVILMNVVKLASAPMGLLLLVGAIYFRMEVNRTLRNKR
ncbi:MAG: hypothetical protein FWE88_02280 [Phycisphaerae bacterium]|nr:hypothetical protein [Phycisphaerae bacterium]